MFWGKGLFRKAKRLCPRLRRTPWILWVLVLFIIIITPFSPYPSLTPKTAILDPPKEIQIGRRIPSSLLNLKIDDGKYALVVEKATQRLLLYSHGSQWKLMKVYQCATGKRNGDKQKEGDLRTPEGIYHFIEVKQKKDLSPIYGVMAFVLDYPNS